MSIIKIFNLENISKFKLNQNEIDYIKFLLSDQLQIFNDIQDQINLLIVNDSISLQDLPSIVLIISDIIHINFVNISNKIDIINVIQYIIDTILDSGLLPLPNIELQIIKSIVDTSIQLLKKNVYLIKKEEQYCWNLFCV